MSNTTVVKVVVQELTKYGFKANGKFVNYSKQITEADKAKVVPGAAFEAEYYIADSGKEYLNKVLGNTSVVHDSPKAEAKPDADRAKHFTPKFEKKTPAVADSDKMSKADWSAKDRNMMIGGRSHDAAVLVAAALTVGCTIPEALKQYQNALEGLLKIADEVK